MKAKVFKEIDPENPFAKLYSWESPERVWKQKTRAWYISYSLFFLVIIAFLALIGEFILIIAIIAFVFLWFIQGAVPPHMVETTITTLGIRTFNKLFRWRNVKNFWFSKKDDNKFLNLEISEDDNPRFTKRVSLVVNGNDDRDIFEILVQYSDYAEKDELGFNPLMKILHGSYIEVSHYLPENLDEPEYLEFPK